MKVALISFHTFSRPGGVKRHVLGLHKEFQKKGIYSKIIAPRRKRKEFYGKDVILLGTSFPIFFSGSQSDFDINFNPLSIERVLNREKFNVLHFHNFTPLSAFQILDTPAASKTLNILTCHFNIEDNKLLEKFPVFLSLLNKTVQWKIDGIIGVAPLNLKPFKDYSGPKKVIPNGIDLEIFNPNRPKIKKFLDDKINILFLGRIEERKGLIYLLNAYKILQKKFSNLRLIIVGSGPLKSELEKWVKDNNLANVVFEGEAKEEMIASYYSTCDIFCAPAIFGESFGLVLIEAMACGKPVVAFANKGYKGILAQKKGAEFLAPPKNYKILAQKLEILIRDKKLREEMGQWGIEESKRYSWDKVADEILDFYKLCEQYKQKRNKRKNSSLKDSIKKIFRAIVKPF